MKAKNIVAPLAAAVLAAAGQGCFSLEHAPSVNRGEEHVLVSNYGWYLFGCIPLVCGNGAEDAWFPTVLFCDDVTMDKVQKSFMDYAAERGKTDIRELSYSNDDTVLFKLPFTDFPIPVPYVLTYREIMLSGMIREKAPAAEAAAGKEAGK